MSNDIQFVDFETYCKTCKYEVVKETHDPCNECLDICAKESSNKPEKWEAK